MIFIDSDIIIDYLKGKKEVVDTIQKIDEEIATTEINVFEIMFGIYLKKQINENELIQAKEFFSMIKIFSFEKNCPEKAAKILSTLIKKGETIDQNDCIIASIVLNNGYEKFITNNKKHFKRINELKLL